jgi:hypothetical protein
VVTGGARARVHFLPDRFASKADWRAIDAMGIPPLASAGLFSVARRDDGFIAVGGDYKKEGSPAPAFAFRASPDIGAAGDLFSGSPTGYRSGIACAAMGRGACVATGPGGTDLLPAQSGNLALMADDDGTPGAKSTAPATHWVRLSDAGYDSVATSGRAFWFSGDSGRLGRLELPSPE